MSTLIIKLYNNFLIIYTLIFIFLIPNYSNSVSLPTKKIYTSNLNFIKNLNDGFFAFINTHNFKNDINDFGSGRNVWLLFEKPIYETMPPPKSLIPKRIHLDYENLLRSHDPSKINFNTRLCDFPGVEIRDIDNLYGKIYDRRVLMKQMRYFLERDDFNSIWRLMEYNRDVFNRRDCDLLVKDFDHLMFARLKYEYPEPENLDRTMPFLVSRYVLQHVLQQDLESRLNYKWLEPGEIPEKLPKYSEDYVEPKASPENPIHVRDTAAYRSLMNRLENYDENLRLCAVRDLFHRLIECKRKKLTKSLRRFQRLKPFKSLSYRRKVANKIDIDRVSPFLSKPMRCTDEIVKIYTDHFEEAVNKQDLATACRLLNRYSRRIIFIDKFPLLRKFMRLFAEIHASKKYNLQALKWLRSTYWSTVKRHKFLIRYNEPMMVMEAGKTLKDLYEEQLEQYRKRRDAINDEKMKKMGVNMDEVRDFSNAYGEDWIPILYPKEFEEGIKYQQERLDKLRKKAEKELNEERRRRSYEDYEMEEEIEVPKEEDL
ncbi:uncharacterized protein TA19360 [Theileria annulata]|uniref:Uncharacterized protein n=1 Tax=Theileria annulata TaxID=5874 RepID=Q4UGE3_THEAN|nr:uncharacterized protein TA19360 [Theileria annulata]CAI73846.1 hypothetical protein, conserved [Theileria annulata]|eukprot:XP_954523.1 hypothetical protein, conserved [Theileria annulata]